MNKILSQELLKLMLVASVGMSSISAMATVNTVDTQRAEVVSEAKEQAESNDTIETANLIEVNTIVSGKLGMKDAKGEKDREDYFKVILTEPGLLEVSFEGAEGVNNIIKLLGQNGDKKLASANGVDKTLQMSQRLEAGTYYIRLNAGTGDGGEYKLTAAFTATGDTMDTEPNDLFSDGAKYQIGSTVTGHIGYVDELGLIDKEDWYKIILTKETNLHLMLTPSNDVSVFLKLYDDSKQLKTASGKNKAITLDTVLEPGTYYIAVKRSVGAGEYTLSSINSQE